VVVVVADCQCQRLLLLPRVQAEEEGERAPFPPGPPTTQQHVNPNPPLHPPELIPTINFWVILIELLLGPLKAVVAVVVGKFGFEFKKVPEERKTNSWSCKM
jgi:hypothetical protein